MDAKTITGFCDLNITFKPDNKLLERIIEFEYRVIALNWTVDASKLNTNKWTRKKKGEKTDSNLVIFPPQLAQSYSNIVSKNFKNMKVFLRITIVFSTPEQLKQVLSFPDIKLYDIVAALPTNNAAYEHACNNQSIDLISFEIGVTNFKPSGKLHKILVSRSGYFEIMYTQAIKGSTKRQELLTMTQYFNIYGKFRNAIISSGASHYLELRNPFDVANLAILFGFKEVMAKSAISHSCKTLLLVAAGKKYGKTAITVELIPEEEEPSRKRPKLTPKDEISKVAESVSSLTTTDA